MHGLFTLKRKYYLKKIQYFPYFSKSDDYQKDTTGINYEETRSSEKYYNELFSEP